LIEDSDEEIESNPEGKLWHIVKHAKFVEHNGQASSTTIQGYKLMPNDVIKLGRVRFKVCEIVSPAYKKKQALAMSRLKLKSHQDVVSYSKLQIENSVVDVSPEHFEPVIEVKLEIPV